MANIKNLIGYISGRLTVVGYSNKIVNKKGRIYHYWQCICECGKSKIVSRSHLTTQHTKSCGCLSKERLDKINIVHGLCFTKEYSRWSHMKARCYNPKDKDYNSYGGRGIQISEEWVYDFKKFYEDMGRMPFSDSSIERIDVNGNYCKENCKWIPVKEQAKNRRNNRRITFKGETKLITEWCKELGVSSVSNFSKKAKSCSEEMAIEYYKNKLLKKEVASQSVIVS